MSGDTVLRETRIAEVRRELKIWEKAFSDRNGGRKAGRDDIRNDATIGA